MNKATIMVNGINAKETLQASYRLREHIVKSNKDDIPLFDDLLKLTESLVDS